MPLSTPLILNYGPSLIHVLDISQIVLETVAKHLEESCVSETDRFPARDNANSLRTLFEGLKAAEEFPFAELETSCHNAAATEEQIKLALLPQIVLKTTVQLFTPVSLS